MKLISTTIRSFMSFGPEEMTQVWEDIGLVLFEGENQAAKSASSNGAGKTNLMEAVIWCNFGKTTKGVGADDVVNDKVKKGCMVRNDFVDRATGERWAITRYRKDAEYGNNLIFKKVTTAGETIDLNGVDIDATQSNIDNFLGGSFTLFCNSTYFSQNNIRPFSLFTDKQIKESLIEALDLNRFTGAMAVVRDDLKVLRGETATVTGKLKRVDEEIVEATARRDSYKTSDAAFEDNKAANISKLETKLEGLKLDLGYLAALKAKRTTLIKEMEKRLKTISELDIVKEDLATVMATVTPLATNIKVLEAKHGDIHRQFTIKMAEIKNIKSRIGTNCPECGKGITEADMEALLIASTTAAGELRRKADSLSNLISKASGAKGKFDERVGALNAQIAAANAVAEEIRKFDGEAERIRVRLDETPRVAKDITELEETIRKAHAEKSPFAALIAKEMEMIEDRQNLRKTLADLVKAKSEEVCKLEYLEVMFGYSGIPAFLLEMVVPYLNERANHYAMLVCDGEVQINFSSTSRTKTGKINEKFAIDVSHTSGASKYRGISGGERKRADLCIAQAMQDLCRLYGKTPLDIVFYDEPFEHLDATGVGGVAEMLTAIGKEIGTVAVVTHNDEMKSMFENRISIVKAADGFSRLAA